MRIDIRTNLASVQHELSRLRDDIRERAIARALNRTAEQGRTQMIRGITGEFNIRAKDVREQVKLKKAKEGNFGLMLHALLEAFGRVRGRRSRNVMLFDARVVKRRGRRGGGVSVRIKRYGGRKLIEGAFIGNKGRTVFQRVGKERLPIRAVETIDVQQMFNTRRINQAVIAFIKEKFPEILEREVAFYVRRFAN